MKKGLLFSLMILTLPLISQEIVYPRMKHHPAEKSVEVFFGDKLFTVYRYEEALLKPVLFPILTRRGDRITRNYPLVPTAGERADHPHHFGLWLNYGNVNGLDFWNNSSQVPPDKKNRYGRIKPVGEPRIHPEKGILTVDALWVSSDDSVLLEENTVYNFYEKEGIRGIDRVTTLTAREKIQFTDNKEGMFGLRVARELELPEETPVLLTGLDGKPESEKRTDNTRVSGDYLSSTGIRGGSVWGTRADWMSLTGKIDGNMVTIVMIDHPENPGHPTYWHARGYGLFAANPLGQKIFDPTKELNLALEKGQSVTFKFRVLINGDSWLDGNEIEKWKNDFWGK